jgi:hypothetical protein
MVLTSDVLGDRARPALDAVQTWCTAQEANGTVPGTGRATDPE